mgnify:FL=1
MCKQYEHTIAITNRALVQGDFLEQMQKVIRLHPHAVILREKDLSDDAYEALAEKILGLCEAEGVRCFLHSRIAIARKLGCRRIHLSVPVLEAMSEAERIGLKHDFAEISVSCHSLEDVDIAVKNGATQIILGTIFETECKKGLKGKGTGFVEAICKSCPLPVYAIGGISLERLPQVRKAGAAGGCMMSGFMKL